MKLIFSVAVIFIATNVFAQSNSSTFSTGDPTNTKLAFSENGKFLAVLSGKNTVGIYQIDTELLTNTIQINEFKEIHEVIFGSKNRCFVSGKLKSGFGIANIDISIGDYKITIRNSSQITGIASIKKTSTLLFTTAAGNLHSFNTQKYIQDWEIKAHTGHALDVSYSREGKFISTAGSDGYVGVYDLQGKELAKKKISDEWVREVCNSHNGDMIIAGTDDAKLYSIFPNAQFTIEPIPTIRLKGYISEIALAPNDQAIAASTTAGDVLIWSFVQNQQLRHFEQGGSKKNIKGLGFNPNGQSVFASSIGSNMIINYDVSVLGITPQYRFKDEDDKTAPLVHISNPPILSSGKVTYSKDRIKITGSAVDESGVHKIKINGYDTPIKDNGNFVINLPLQMGDNFITIEVADVNDNTTIKRFVVNRRNLNGEEYDPADAKNYLFIVGINSYEYWPQLFNAVKDAKDVANVLVGMYDFEFSDVKMLINEQASLNNIYSELRSYIERIGPQDNLVIYYSGHGFYDDLLSEGYWIPYNAKLNALGEYLPNSSLLKILKNINSQHTFMVVDACFSGSLFVPSNRGYVENVEKYKSRWGLASGRLETVSDGAYGTNSPFASNFIEFLKKNEKDELPVSELVQAVKVKVADENNQTPIGNTIKNIGDEGGEFIFRKKH